MNSDSFPGATMELAQFVASMGDAELDNQTSDYAKRLLLDGIGCLIAGTQGSVAKMATRAFDGMLFVADGPSTNLVSGRSTSARDAAFVNGIALYSIGLNDIHRSSVSHPGGCVIPAVLAVGQWKRSAGTDLLKAMTCGYELMARLGAAMQPSHWDRGFHPTGTFGTFGATAAVGRLMDLDVDTMASAFGIAGSQASGIQAYHADGSLTMVYHAGRAAQNGVEAAMLASEGFTGPHSVFEDSLGYLAIGSTNPDVSALTRGLGKDLAINSTSFRPYYGCTATIAASSAAEAIAKRRPGQTDAIRRITVRVHPEVVKIIDYPNPRTLLAARLSMQFNVAIVLDRGSVLMRDADDSDLHSASIRRLVGISHVTADPAVSFWGSAVEVEFADGTVDAVLDENPKGDPANPMTWSEVETKFRALTEPTIKQCATEIVNLVHELEGCRGDQLVEAIRHALRHSR